MTQLSSQLHRHSPYLISMRLKKHKETCGIMIILIILNSGILISDPTFEEEQLAAGLTSITMEGTSVTHMYKPGKFF